MAQERSTFALALLCSGALIACTTTAVPDAADAGSGARRCGNGILESGEQCEGGLCCDSDCAFKAAGTSCRSASGPCDIAESCSGNSAACPEDGFASDGEPCPDGTCQAQLCTSGQSIFPVDGSLTWSGIRWAISSQDPQSTWIDSQGRLHLVLAKVEGQWRGTSLESEHYYRYGKFVWKASTAAMNIERGSTFGMFTYHDDAHEIDIQVGQRPEYDHHLWFINQPVDQHPENIHYGVDSSSPYLNATNVTFTIDWEPTHIDYSAVASDGSVIEAWRIEDASRIPQIESKIVQSFLANYGGPLSRQEIILSSFEYSAGSVAAVCGNGVLEGDEKCEGGPCCEDCAFKAASTVCRPANGPCDIAESCTGNSAACPADETGTCGGCPPANPEPIPTNRFRWQGHDWLITDWDGTQFDTSQACVDDLGKLHLRAVDSNGRLNSFILLLDRVTYGSFSLTLDSDWSLAENYEPYRWAVFGPYLYDGTLTAANGYPNQNHGEIDIEASNWGDPNLDGNVDFTFYSIDMEAHGGNYNQYTPGVKGTGNTWTIEWMPDHVTLQVTGPNVWQGTQPAPYNEGGVAHNPLTLTKADFQAMGGDVPPSTGNMQYNIYLGPAGYASQPWPAGFNPEVVLSSFRYIPSP